MYKTCNFNPKLIKLSDNTFKLNVPSECNIIEGNFNIDLYPNITLIIPDNIKIFKCSFYSSKPNTFTIQFDHLSFDDCQFDSLCFNNVHTFKFANEEIIKSFPKEAVGHDFYINISYNTKEIRTKLKKRYENALNEMRINLNLLITYVNEELTELSEDNITRKIEIINNYNVQFKHMCENIIE